MSEFESWEAGESRRDRIDQLRGVRINFGSLFEEEQKELAALEALGPTPPRDLGHSRWHSDEDNATTLAAARAAWEKDQQKRVLGEIK